MKNTIDEKIKELIKETLKNIGISYDEEILLEHPAEETHGDYSTNIAMKLAKEVHKNPLEIASQIAAKIPANDFLEKVEAVKPGFINFFLNKEYLVEEMGEILKTGGKYNKNSKFKIQNSKFEGKKYMVEFAHPNTHKMFHIGHLRNAVTGEAISRILEANGVKVVRANYEGDVGMHIAKCLYSILQISNLKSQISKPNVKSENLVKCLEEQYKTIKERVEFLGKMYAEGNKAYETDNAAKEEINRINKMIYAKDPEVYELWKETRQWSLDYFETIYKRIYTRFDRYYFESEVYERGKELVVKGLEKGSFESSEGAVVFPGEKFGLHTRVFITKEGNVTYEGKDMGLGEMQFKEYNPDLIIHNVGPEQAGYFQVMFQALSVLFPETKRREKHLVYGWVKLKEGKMSSRSGNVVLGEWLLDEAKVRVEKIMEGVVRGVETQSIVSLPIDDISEKVAVAAVKYSFLKVSLPMEIAFDFEESINFQGDSGPYLQYTFARTRSVIAKSQISNLKSQIQISNLQIFNSLNLQPEELPLLRWLYRFPEIVGEAGEHFAPNMISSYLFELAQRYNLFYNKLPIIKAESSEVRDFRLALNETVGIIIKNGLYLLGIEAVEKM